MRDWTFENDNGRNPQTGLARRYVEHWEDMRTDNIGCLFWGGVGTAKATLQAVSQTPSWRRNPRPHDELCSYPQWTLPPALRGATSTFPPLSYPLLILDDFGMERGTEYGLEQVFNVMTAVTAAASR